jgi:hypothetical protein
MKIVRLPKFLKMLRASSVKTLPQDKKTDAKANLLKYGPELYKFIKKHGEVDASHNGQNTEVTSNLLLAGAYKEVHKLEGKVNRMLAASTAGDTASSVDKAPSPPSAPDVSNEKHEHTKDDKPNRNRYTSISNS